MDLDNDLIDLWLRAGDLDRDTIRRIIEAVQESRNDADSPGVPDSCFDRLDRLAGFVEDLPEEDDRKLCIEEIDAITADLRDLQMRLDGVAPGDNRPAVEDVRRMAFVPRVAQPETKDLLS